jgi:hypothetical protein
MRLFARQRAAGWSLPAHAMDRLTAVSHLAERYPESMEKDMRQRREKAVGG